jgi:hypothetical protein
MYALLGPEIVLLAVPAFLVVGVGAYALGARGRTKKPSKYINAPEKPAREQDLI